MYSWQQPEDEDEEEEVQHGGGKSLTLFLVDANTAMGERREGDPDGYTALQRLVDQAEPKPSVQGTVLCSRYNQEQDIHE